MSRPLPAIPRPGDVIGAYTLGPRLGEGGMGVVFEATETLLGRPWVVKMIRPELGDRDDLRRRFVQEAQLLAMLDHPGIVRLHTFFQHEGALVLVMERLEGRTLEDALLAEPQHPISRCVAWLTGLARAVGYAHRHERGPVIHRDLKPSNVFLCGSAPGHVKVLDFGLARAAEAAGATATGQMLGTPLYLPPEVLKGELSIAALKPDADVFALGMIAYRLVAGRPPVDAPSGLDHSQLRGLLTVHYARGQSFPDVRRLRPDCPAALGAAIMAALATVPADRPRDALAWLNLWAEAAAGGPSPAPIPSGGNQPDPHSTFEPGEARGRRTAASTPVDAFDGATVVSAPPRAPGRRGLIAGTAAAALAVVVGLGFALTGKDDEVSSPAPVPAGAPASAAPASAAASTVLPPPTAPPTALASVAGLDALITVDVVSGGGWRLRAPLRTQGLTPHGADVFELPAGAELTVCRPRVAGRAGDAIELAAFGDLERCRLAARPRPGDPYPEIELTWRHDGRTVEVRLEDQIGP